MDALLRLAHSAQGEVPIAARLVSPGGRLGISSTNNSEDSLKSLGHAEMIVMRETLQLTGSRRLPGFSLYVTLEPCPMCASAASMLGISRLVFGAYSDIYGAAGSKYDLFRDGGLAARGEIEVVGGILERECSEVISNFFALRR